MERIDSGNLLVFLGVLAIAGSWVAIIHQWLKDPDKE